MAINTIGDIVVTTPDNLTANEGIAVEHYLTELGVIQVNEYDNEMLSGMLMSVPQRGNKVSIPRALGVNNFREVDINSDRSVQAASLRATRVEGVRRAFDLDFVIPNETEPEVQISWVNQGLVKFRGAKARLVTQVVIDALNSIRMTDSTAAAADGIAAMVAAPVRFDPVNKVRAGEDGSGTPQKWNIQKLNKAKTLLEYGNVMPGARNNIVLANCLTYDGFSSDEQAVNKDYEANTFGEVSWVKVGEFPAKEDGTPGGFRRSVSNVGGVDYDLIDEYIFGTESVLLITSSENPMFEVEIVRDPLRRRLVVVGTAYLGAMVLNPKGVVLVKNHFTT